MENTDAGPFDFGNELNEASAADQAFYADNGYFIAKGIFSPDECRVINARAEALAPPDFAAQQNLHAVDPGFLHYLRCRRVVSLLETIRPQTLMGLHTQMLYKKAGTPYAAQSWNPHQDNSYIQNPNNLYVTTNLFLADTDKENGGMYLYPGSLKAGLLPYEPTISFREKPGTSPGNNITDIPAEYERIDLTAGQGDMLVMNGCLIHGSYPNRSESRSRPMLSCTYLPVGEYFLPGKTAKRKPIELHDF